MPERMQLTIATGPTFDARIERPAPAPLVLLLLGFPQPRHSWRAQLPALAAAAYRGGAGPTRLLG